MNILESRFNKITTIVPKFAKSAATLMSLGTDEIYLNPESALGPLDLPIEHHRDGSRISALDVRNTTTSVAALAESLAKSRYDFLREREISTLEASRLAFHNTNEFLQPIMQQVDPYHLQKAERELRIGLRYAIKMLTRRMMKADKAKAEKTAMCLVNDFPAHEYSIYSDDAKDLLGLEVKNLSDLKEWNEILKKKYDLWNWCSYRIEYGIIEEVDPSPEYAESRASEGDSAAGLLLTQSNQHAE